MRKLAKVLTIVTMAVLGLGIILFAGARPRAAVVAADLAGASAREEVFETFKGAIESGDMGSDQFKTVSELDPARYDVVTYRVSTRNMGILPMEWARLTVTPAEGDVAILSLAEDIGPFGTKELTASLLTESGGEAKRDIQVTYYILGTPGNTNAEWSD